MLLSVCLIARNEAQNLPRALKSVAGVAEEIIVTDTGSTDQTPGVAAGLGAKVSHFPWRDDFSASRNFAVSQARGQWVLWLDADEELLPASIPELRGALDNPAALAYHVLRQDLLDAERPEHFTEMWQLRLFRRLPELVFQGRCHPHFQPPIREVARDRGLQVFTSGITLRHYGYLPELRPAKLTRAARLLELELQERPGQLYYLIELARTLSCLNDSRALEVAGEAVAQILPRQAAHEAPIPMVAALFEYLLQLPDDPLPGGLTRKQLHHLIRKWFPASPPLWWIMARQTFGRGDYPRAELLLRHLLHLGETRTYDKHLSFDPSIMGADAWLNLGVALVRQAKLKEAEHCFRLLLKSGLRSQEAQTNLKVIEDLRKKVQRRRPGGKSGPRKHR